MKKAVYVIAFALALLIWAAAFAAPAEETPAPSPTPAPSLNPSFTPAPAAEPFGGLISLNALQNATYEDVVRVQIRLRDLCYFPFKPTGNYQSMTANAAKAFQLKHTTDDGAPMISDGTIGTQTMDILFRHSVDRADITAGIPIGATEASGTTINGELAVWSEVKPLLTEGAAYTITDFYTGASFSMMYTGGENHAEMEAADAASAAAFIAAFGGQYNFSKRPVTILIGARTIAASLYGYPHGQDKFAYNDMDGHVCLFFDGSLSNVSALPDAEHQETIRVAAGY